MIYVTVMSVTRKNTEKINTIALSQTGIAIDQIFSDIYAAGRRILNQEAVVSLAYTERPLTPFKLEKIGKLQASLDEYAAHSNYFRKIYVYFSYPEFAATTEGLYGTKASFLRDLEKEAGPGSPVLSWMEEGRPFQVYMAYSQNSSRADKIVVIMSDIPTGALPNVVCVIIMDYKAVHALLESYGNGTDNESPYIWLFSPAEDRIISSDISFRAAEELGIDFSTDPDYREILKTQGMAVTVLPSKLTGWTIISAIPARQYMKELILIQRVYLIFLLTCLGAGTLISIIFALKNYRPVRNLSTILETAQFEKQGSPGYHRPDYRSEFDYLADSIILLLEKKRGYEKEIDRQRSLLSENNLVKMLRGAIYSAQAFEAACGEYGFNFSSNCFWVIGVDINEYSGSLYQKEEEASAEDLIETLHLAIGCVFEEMLRQFCDCYACRYEDRIFVIASRRNAEENGGVMELKNLCLESAAVIQERFSVKIAVYISGLYAERTSGAMNIHDAYEETFWGLSQIKDLHEQEAVMIRQDVLNVIQASEDAAREEDTVPLYAEIVRYINENYTDRNLCVTSIADHFSFSKSYLLRVFKKGENCGILDYIHQRRVDEAKVLLRSTKSGINEIAAKIGYTNGLTMIRAFKRLEGVTPTVYRHISAGAFSPLPSRS
jgi:AraC-like DNA-binding protein